MRTKSSLNEGWEFRGPDGSVESVNVPHTWNAIDGQDGGNDYWRGTCTYSRTFATPEFDVATQRVWLEFDGVNASADVRVNGQDVCHHDGGYSTFRADVTEALLASGDNALEVAVDNSKNDRVYPQKADFTFYGGIYRDVRLVVVDARHFALGHFGGPGYAVTPAYEGDTTKVRVQSWLEGEGAESCAVRVTLLDREGSVVACGEGTDVVLTVEKPHLWDGVDDPYLYNVELALVDGEATIDEVGGRFGIRTFSVDPNKGFFLNGRSYPLRGVARHQDRKGLGNALTAAEHAEDIELIRQIGANTVRLAHYQHSQTFYDLCDEAGLVVWAEIPYISEHLPNGRENTISQMKELVIQNYNHACICVWGVSNEITISTKDKKDMLDNHHVLNDMLHEMDPTRLTTLACYAMCGWFNRSAHVTDLVSWNLYLGWYVPGLFLNKLWFGVWRLFYRNRPIGMSEYGCEAMPNLHSEHPRRNDHTEEYQCVYHEYMLRFFAKRPYLWATHVWNMFDFAADARDQGGEPGMNHKGLVTFDRQTLKDSFFIYKAWWSKDPFVHICSKRFHDRAQDAISVKVYSNQPEVSLYVDGKLVETRKENPRDPHVFRFFVTLDGGTVQLGARAGECADQAEFARVDAPNPAYKLAKKKDKQKSNWVDA